MENNDDKVLREVRQKVYDAFYMLDYCAQMIVDAYKFVFGDALVPVTVYACNKTGFYEKARTLIDEAAASTSDDDALMQSCLKCVEKMYDLVVNDCEEEGFVQGVTALRFEAEVLMKYLDAERPELHIDRMEAIRFVDARINEINGRLSKDIVPKLPPKANVPRE